MLKGLLDMNTFEYLECLVCSKEIREGGHQLLEKLQMYRPLIAVFNGKCKSLICYRFKSKHLFMM